MRLRRITGQLEARSAVHIGTGTTTGTTDALCRRDAAGRLIIPGFALAGGLRALATRLSPRLGPPHGPRREAPMDAICAGLDASDRDRTCRCAVCLLFGSLNPRDEERITGDAHRESSPRPKASRVHVRNARSAAPAASTTVRDMVGIDRVDGAAARRAAARFDLELVPAGAVFLLDLEYEALADDAADPGEELLAAALAEWAAGRATLGGRASRGCGAFDLRELACQTVDFTRPNELLAFLRQTGDRWSGVPRDVSWLDTRVALARPRVVPAPVHNDHVARAFVAATVRIQADGPFLVNDGVHALWSGFDHAPVLARLVDGLPVLPGSGFRGALRFQAERIARTLALLDAPDEPAYLASCPACNPLAASLPGEQGAEGESCDSLLRRQGLLRGDEEVGEAALCLGCRLFGSPQAGSRLIVEDALLVRENAVQGTTAEIDGVVIGHKPQDFVAIDRFTGGASGSAKFDAEPLWRPAFDVRIRLDNPRTWELGWLLLALRDLHDGQVPLGFGGAKGYGCVTVKAWDVAVGRLTRDDLTLEPADPLPAMPSGIYSVVRCSSSDVAAADVSQALGESWVRDFRGQVRTFRRAPSMTLPSDAYFGSDAAVLYPLSGGPYV